MSVGARIRRIREDQGLTRAQVEERGGGSEQQVYQWETERRTLTLESAVRLADALGVTLDDLVGRSAEL